MFLRPKTCVAHKIAEASKGVVFFEGQVSQSTTKTEGGFTVGSFEIAGDGRSDGQTIKVDFKNENMICWADGKPVATIPEIITIFDLETGEVAEIIEETAHIAYVRDTLMAAHGKSAADLPQYGTAAEARAAQ